MIILLHIDIAHFNETRLYFQKQKNSRKMVLFPFSNFLTVWSNGKQMETHLLSQSVCWKCFLNLK